GAVRARDREARVAAASMTLVSGCGLLCLARIILRVSTGGALSSFLLPLSVVLFVYMWLELFPMLERDEATRRQCRSVSAAVLVVAVVATAVTLSLRYQRKFSYPIVSERGTWLTSQDLGVAFSQGLAFIEKTTEPGEPIAVFPEGSALTFLSGRSNPLREEIFTPGFLDAKGEARAIEMLRSSKTPLIFVANRYTSEFGEAAFGKDYDRALMGWIETNYQVCGMFGIRQDPSLQVGAPEFFLRAYCRKS